jgi:hypothetical protein
MRARASSSSFFTTSPKDGVEEDPFLLSLTYASRPAPGRDAFTPDGRFMTVTDHPLARGPPLGSYGQRVAHTS